jgi:sigma54-dependent transcription regulator
LARVSGTHATVTPTIKPYEPKRGGFLGDFSAGFFPLNLAALSPTLIESELFCHRRGAFTGALADRAGWMEVCPPSGAVFHGYAPTRW